MERETNRMNLSPAVIFKLLGLWLLAGALFFWWRDEIWWPLILFYSVAAFIASRMSHR